MTASPGPAGTHPHAFLWGAVVAVGLHGLMGVALALAPPRVWRAERPVTVEIDVAQATPPEPLPPPPPPEPLPPPPEHHPVARRHIARPTPPPPVPNQETKPAAHPEDPQPVFGVTEDSVVAGESPVAVPVGNTLMTKDRTLAKAPPAPLPPAPLPPAFAPVDEEAVSEFPEVLVKPETKYPELALRMNIGGKVRLKLGIDRKGNVKSVRVLDKAGYGMDEEAVRVVWQYKFRPAKGKNGQPVDFVITYDFTFRSPVQ